MDWTHLLLLSVLQGLTEFLPISSSAHLILLPSLNGWDDQGLAFDIAVHVGTLGAVVLYFRRELAAMARDWTRSLAERRSVGESRLAWAVLWGIVPVGVAGIMFKDVVETDLRSPVVIAYATIGFGLLLGLSDWAGRRQRGETTIGWLDVFVIGLAQAVALIPGTSRSGITMTAALARGLTRQAAARFSFLLSVPVLALAGGYQSYQLFAAPGTTAAVWGPLVLGALFSGVSAYACIHVFLKLLDRIGMWPFVLYRLVLGGALLWWFT